VDCLTLKIKAVQSTETLGSDSPSNTASYPRELECSSLLRLWLHWSQNQHNSLDRLQI